MNLSCIVKTNCYDIVQPLKLSIQASDNRNRQSTATVIVTVLRDLRPPVFTNLPTRISLDESNAVDR